MQGGSLTIREMCQSSGVSRASYYRRWQNREPGEEQIAVRDAIQKLTQLPGVGEWTAQYFAMRAYGWPDAFPASDLGILKALKVKKSKDALKAAEKWRPWRAYAAIHLWKSLESGRGEVSGEK